MPGPVDIALIIAGSTIAALSGFRWGRHAALTMCRQDDEGEGQ